MLPQNFIRAGHPAEVLLHAAAAGLFVLVLRRLLTDRLAPWLGGLLFALHPVAVESVAWISEQKNTLSTVFYLLAVLELCWAAAMWAFEQEHLTSLGAEMVKKIMFIGFFYTLLHYAPAWIPAITRTFSFLVIMFSICASWFGISSSAYCRSVL